MLERSVETSESREPEIAKLLSLLQQHVTQLEEALDHLDTRLLSVLQPHSPLPAQPKTEKETTYLAPLAQSLHVQVISLGRCNDRLTSYLSRLEL